MAFANSEAALDGAPPTCGPFSSPPIDLGSCEMHRSRFARIEFLLHAPGTTGRPFVRDIQLKWARP